MSKDIIKEIMAIADSGGRRIETAMDACDKIVALCELHTTDLSNTQRQAVTPNEGTFKCPICASDEPHYHDANLQWKRMPADQLGWLIETGDHKYWDGRKANDGGFTDDPNDAVRFARFEDSERVIHWLMRAWSVFLVSRQHSWMGGIAQTAPRKHQALSGLTAEEKEHQDSKE